MRNVSIKRLVTVMLATTIAVVSPAMQQAFATPMPQEAGLEEIASRIKFAGLMSVNALIPAMVGALMGFFTRADKTEPVFALTRKGDE
jgi:flagellar biosynthesis protein FliP